MPGLLVPGLVPVGGRVGVALGLCCTNGPPTLLSAIREPGLEEWWGPPERCAELSAGPRSRGPAWPAKRQRRHPARRAGWPHGFQG